MLVDANGHPPRISKVLVLKMMNLHQKWAGQSTNKDAEPGVPDAFRENSLTGFGIRQPGTLSNPPVR